MVRPLPEPPSPELARKATPGWSKYVANWPVASCTNSGTFQLLLTATAPIRAAVALPMARSFLLEEFAATTRMWQSGHALLTASTSRAVSTNQPIPMPCPGSFEPPSWLTTVRHPFAVVQGASPNCARYVARSDSRVG
jgi:hypothetical protein